jgi:membrane protein DedA with SNARE-associated domain
MKVLPTSVEARPLDFLLEVLTILVTSFIFNLIPFAGPSNLLIASNAAVLASVEPYIVGIMVATGSATAKFIHYLVMFFLGKHVGKERRKRLDENSEEIKKWAIPALFIVAATPLPDEPIVIPLGLLKYNPGKLFLAYFAGKLLIGVVGAYLGIYALQMFGSMFTQEVFITLSIVATVVITIVFLKVDIKKLAERILKRKIEFIPSKGEETRG